jgi:uncharacterized protein (DUF1800 family)
MFVKGEVGIMKSSRSSANTKKSLAIIALLLAASLFCQPAFLLVAAQRKKEPRSSSASMTDDQKIAQVLSRLTFGARPGDFERVKQMGVAAFIDQQLGPDLLDNTLLLARLKRLPTLNMATPVIIEQYTPPKPVASPSPAAKIAENSISQTPNSNSPSQEAGRMTAPQNAMPNEMRMDAKKDPTEMTASPQASPKPTPPPKNPQMVVTELQRAKLLRAVYSEQQLFEVMVDFWENHFSIFANKDDDRYLLTAFDRETIRPFRHGTFPRPAGRHGAFAGDAFLSRQLAVERAAPLSCQRRKARRC